MCATDTFDFATNGREVLNNIVQNVTNLYFDHHTGSVDAIEIINERNEESESPTIAIEQYSIPTEYSAVISADDSAVTSAEDLEYVSDYDLSGCTDWEVSGTKEYLPLYHY